MWKPVHLFAFKKKFDFLGQRKAALILSTLINVVAILGVIFVGLNLGASFDSALATENNVACFQQVLRHPTRYGVINSRRVVVNAQTTKADFAH